jgi:signal transduction histidine kinase
VQGGVREALCVPLQGRYDIVGALYIDTYTSPGQIVKRGKTHRFTDEHLRLITAIGHQAALAIEDTFYYSALLQSERLAAMGQTIATLSHHVKNILQGIRGGSYLIESGLKRDDTNAVRRGWGMVDRNQERISNLVMDMLTFSKEREPQRVDADLNETTADVVELMTTRASDAGVELSFMPDNDMPMANYDPDALHQAILNLVTNAIDAVTAEPALDQDALVAGPKGAVAISTCFDPELGWCVDVLDNGPGISPADREKIFSLFESKKGARGTGLGLPVSAKILKEHGGAIEILDPPSGSGCCFRLCLPRTNHES